MSSCCKHAVSRPPEAECLNHGRAAAAARASVGVVGRSKVTGRGRGAHISASPCACPSSSCSSCASSPPSFAPSSPSFALSSLFSSASAPFATRCCSTTTTSRSRCYGCAWSFARRAPARAPPSRAPPPAPPPPPLVRSPRSPHGSVCPPGRSVSQSVVHNPYHGALGRTRGRVHHPMRGWSRHRVMMVMVGAPERGSR